MRERETNRKRGHRRRRLFVYSQRFISLSEYTSVARPKIAISLVFKHSSPLQTTERTAHLSTRKSNILFLTIKLLCQQRSYTTFYYSCIPCWSVTKFTVVDHLIQALLIQPYSSTVVMCMLHLVGRTSQRYLHWALRLVCEV